MYANIQKWGNGHAVRLPKAVLEMAFLGENDAVQIVAAKNRIIIKKAASHTHLTLKERLKDFKGEYDAHEWDTGEPVGREVF